MCKKLHFEKDEEKELARLWNKNRNSEKIKRFALPYAQ